VAGGLARRFGIDVTLVRVALVLLALLSGFGLVGYVVAWLLLPLEGERQTVGARAMADRKGMIVVVAFLPALVAVMAVTSALDAGVLSSVAWSGYFAGAGIVLIYRNAGDDERAWLRRAAEPVLGLGASRRSLVLRVLAGLALLAGGVNFLVLGHSRRDALVPLGGAVLVIAAIVVVFGPWWLRLTRDLMSERQARVRAEVRADMPPACTIRCFRRWPSFNVPPPNRTRSSSWRAHRNVTFVPGCLGDASRGQATPTTR